MRQRTNQRAHFWGNFTHFEEKIIFLDYVNMYESRAKRIRSILQFQIPNVGYETIPYSRVQHNKYFVTEKSTYIGEPLCKAHCQDNTEPAEHNASNYLMTWELFSKNYVKNYSFVRLEWSFTDKHTGTQPQTDKHEILTFPGTSNWLADYWISMGGIGMGIRSAEEGQEEQLVTKMKQIFLRWDFENSKTTTTTRWSIQIFRDWNSKYATPISQFDKNGQRL